MAAGSSSGSMLFFGMKRGEVDQGNQMIINHQIQDSDSVPTSSLIPASQSLGSAPSKKKRNQPGMQIPDAEIIALSPTSIMATNRFTCEICYKGFQREQNLQLHKRGHNLPWKLKQKTKELVRRKVYLCPVQSCVHHHPFRALGDLTGIKKHFSRKHGEKKFKCDRCSKMYAVQADCKAHSKTCGMKKYKCDCGTLFSRRDNFSSHRAFCDALSQEVSNRQPPPFSGNNNMISSMGLSQMAGSHLIHHPTGIHVPLYPSSASNQLSYLRADNNLVFGPSMGLNCYKPAPTNFLIPTSDQQQQLEVQGNFHSGFFDNQMNYNTSFMGNAEGSSLLSGPGGSGGSLYPPPPVHNSPHLSATALLKKAARIGLTSSHDGVPLHMLTCYSSSSSSGGVGPFGSSTKLEDGGLDQHFGVAGNSGENNNMDELLNSFTSNDSIRQSFVEFGGRSYDDESNAVVLEELHQPPLERLCSGGLTLTRDFLGVGAGEMVRSIKSSNSNNNGPQSAYGGESFP